MGLKILHIAPFNTAGVPITFVRAERKLGFYSRLVTLGRDRRGYEEDVCLELPFLNSSAIRFAKRIFSHPGKLSLDNQANVPSEIPLQWRPNGWAEKFLVRLRERIWRHKLKGLFNEIDFWNFDVYQLDGGLEFFRTGESVRKLKRQGKKVICCYTGSDLRTRGVIPEIDALSDINVTVEFDHLKLHPKIHHVFFPFECDNYEISRSRNASPVRIGHAPTNRAAKGSEEIILAIKAMEREHSVELVLIEGLPHEEALREKATCHIFVDQIGDLGYGINSLEALAMGIPTCSCLAPGFVEENPGHPFVVVNSDNLKDELLELIRSDTKRTNRGLAGRKWIQQFHDSRRVVQQIHRLANG